MVEILDTTLREGEQTPYVNFLLEEKIEIARMLDQVARGCLLESLLQPPSPPKSGLARRK